MKIRRSFSSLVESFYRGVFFEEGFPENIKSTLVRQISIRPPSSSSCYEESNKYANFLKSIGAQVEIHEGWYHLSNGEVEGHSWVVVEGYLFDPTSIQFGDEMGNIDAYETLETREP